MRPKLIPWLLGVCLLGPGCNLVRNATHNLATEVVQHTDDFWETVRERRLAEEALAKNASDCPGHAVSEDYASGFEAGFIDYLHNGGAGLPPPLPPQHYRRARYETVEGHRAIEDWFEGFRQGASAAQASGLRELVTLPVVMAPPAPPPPLVPPPGSRPTFGPLEPEDVVPLGPRSPLPVLPAPVLPAPRKAEPAPPQPAPPGPGPGQGASDQGKGPGPEAAPGVSRGGPPVATDPGARPVPMAVIQAAAPAPPAAEDEDGDDDDDGEDDTGADAAPATVPGQSHPGAPGSR